MTWLFAALGWAKKAAEGAWGLIRAYPLYCALIALLALQTARIEGVSVWGFGFNGFKQDIADCKAEKTALQTAIDEANAKAREVRAKSVTIAKDVDHDHIERSKVGTVATDRFIAERRIVQPQGGISAAPETGGPGSDQVAPTLPIMVAVSEADVRAAADLKTYADTCFTWVRALNRDGLAD